MAGFWHLSHHQMRDQNGLIMAGAKAYFFEAATTNPITVYQDYGLGTAHPNPVVANGRGIFPPVFLDEEDGFYRQRITNAEGVLVEGTDVGTLPIIGPGDGGGGTEVPVDSNALLQTGDFFWQPRSGSRSGFVRANGRTIGSAVSGASERANADCETLYLHLWSTYSDTFCAVTSGRGISASADWTANKPIGVPDTRGMSPVGLSDMGNSNSMRLDGLTFTTGDKSTAMSTVGAAMQTLSIANMPAHNHNFSDPGHDHAISPFNLLGGANQFVTVSQTSANAAIYAANVIDVVPNTTGIVVQSQGSGTGHNNMQPSFTGTWYIKL